MTGSAADSFTANDQYELNRYVGFIERRKELKTELKQIQDEIDGLHEAHEEMLAMDPKDAHLHFDRNYPPALGFRWAETFTDWEPAAMAEYLEDKIRQMEGQQAEMENDFREIRERMTELHNSLSSRYSVCAHDHYICCSEYHPRAHMHAPRLPSLTQSDSAVRITALRPRTHPPPTAARPRKPRRTAAAGRRRRFGDALSLEPLSDADDADAEDAVP